MSSPGVRIGALVLAAAALLSPSVSWAAHGADADGPATGATTIQADRVTP